MKTLLANKQTEDQRRSNEYARFQFVMAMMNLDENSVGLLLKKDSVFLGHLNNWQFVYWLKKQFSKLDPNMFHSKYIEGISLDFFPGSDVFEFLYAPQPEGETYDAFSDQAYNEEKIFNNKHSFKIKLVLLLENGKIADARIPKHSVCLENVKKCQSNN